MKNVTFDEAKWKLVPLEPTEEMTYACRYVLAGDRDGNIAAPIYRAMLAASPGFARELAGAQEEAPAGQEAQPVATMRTWHKDGEPHAQLDDWRDGIDSLPDGEHLLYAAPPQAPAAVQGEHGELHPECARSAARSALGYAHAFDGRGIDWQSDEPWPHRIELAQALDWITDLGAMVLNLADRIPASPPQAAQQAPAAVQGETPLSKDQIDFILRDSFIAANGSIYATRVYDFVAAIEAAHGIKEKP